MVCILTPGHWNAAQLALEKKKKKALFGVCGSDVSIRCGSSTITTFLINSQPLAADVAVDLEPAVIYQCFQHHVLN